MTAVALTINARAVDASVEPRMPLADFLRDALNLTGTHLGCEHGVCGACTLLIDGEPARSCITYAVACDGADITTIEGLDADEIAGELRAAFTREHALQCGYCTPGMLVSARDLVLRLPDADERSVRLGLSGNLCRCTGYVGIVRAVRSVIEARRARGIGPGGSERLGLGPVGSGRARASMPEAPSRPSPTIPSQEGSGVSDIPDFTPTASFDERFTVPFPPDRVFAFFADTAAVAACLPGASLTGSPSPVRADGVMRVKLGPITAEFRGAARIERDPKTLSGRIVGIGADGRTRSSTQGEIRYALTPTENGAATQVDLSIGYSLRGMLAQVARAGLVRDLAGRLVASFATGLGASLAGEPPKSGETGSTAINGLSLVFASFRDRLIRVWTGTIRRTHDNE